VDGWPNRVKLRFQIVFRPHLNAKPAFLNSSGLKRLFEKLRFRDGYIDYVIESATYGFLFTICKTLENERVSAANE